MVIFPFVFISQRPLGGLKVDILSLSASQEIFNSLAIAEQAIIFFAKARFTEFV